MRSLGCARDDNARDVSFGITNMPFTDDDDFSAIPVMKAGSGIEVVPLQSSTSPAGDPAALAALVLSKSGWREMRDDLRLRFLDIVAGHFRQHIPVGEVREGCVRTREKGGLGMSPVEADAVMDAIREVENARPRQALQRRAPQKSIPVVAPVPAVAPTAVPATTAPHPKTPSSREVLFKKTAALLPAGKETLEIPATCAKEQEKVAASTLKSQPPSPTPSTLPKSREEAIVMLTNQVVTELAFRFPDGYLEDRLRAAVAARLRDIRDWPETEETLLRPPQSGGIGLQLQAVERVRQSLESRVERIHGALYAQQKKDVVAAIAKERAAQESRVAQRSEEDRKELDALYNQVTGKPVVATEKSIAPIPGKRSHTPKPPSTPRGGEGQSMGTSGGSSTIQSPSMTDVRAFSSLVGPVEELRRITLGDFRKLSADPIEATKKILDKLKLLESESFGKRFEGIAALKESEVFTLYYTITRTALMKGVPIAQVIADRTADTLPVLTAAEFNAILALNQTLRF